MNDVQGTLRVGRREGGYRDRVRAYKVMLDGEEVGAIKHGETHEQPIDAGQHELRIKIDWSGSPTETFTVEPGATVEFDCEPNGGTFNVFWQIFTKSSWAKLTRAS